MPSIEFLNRRFAHFISFCQNHDLLTDLFDKINILEYDNSAILAGVDKLPEYCNTSLDMLSDEKLNEMIAKESLISIKKDKIQHLNNYYWDKNRFQTILQDPESFEEVSRNNKKSKIFRLLPEDSVLRAILNNLNKLKTIYEKFAKEESDIYNKMITQLEGVESCPKPAQPQGRRGSRKSSENHGETSIDAAEASYQQSVKELQKKMLNDMVKTILKYGNIPKTEYNQLNTVHFLKILSEFIGYKVYDHAVVLKEVLEMSNRVIVDFNKTPLENSKTLIDSFKPVMITFNIHAYLTGEYQSRTIKGILEYLTQEKLISSYDKDITKPDQAKQIFNVYVNLLLNRQN